MFSIAMITRTKFKSYEHNGNCSSTIPTSFVNRFRIRPKIIKTFINRVHRMTTVSHYKPTGLLSKKAMGDLISLKNMLLWRLTDAMIHIMKKVPDRMIRVMKVVATNTEYMIMLFV